MEVDVKNARNMAGQPPGDLLNFLQKATKTPWLGQQIHVQKPPQSPRPRPRGRGKLRAKRYVS